MRLQGENALLKRQIHTNEQEMAKLATDLKVGQEALQLLEDIANTRRAGMKSKIESVLGEAVRAIYGPRYGVELEYNVKNNRSHLDIFVTKQLENGVVRRTIDGIGGGVADTISIPLRLLVILGANTDRVCFIDEGWKHVNPERVEAISRFVKEVCERLKIQIILVSHHTGMQQNADKIFHFRDDGKQAILIK